MTLAACRYLFGELVKEYPIKATHIFSNESIVHQNHFESGIVKLEKGQVDQRSLLGSTAVKASSKNISHTDECSISHDTCILYLVCKLLKTNLINCLAGYPDVHYIFQLSNFCERFFSRARYALNTRRMSILRKNVEFQMFIIEFQLLDYGRNVIHIL